MAHSDRKFWQQKLESLEAELLIAADEDQKRSIRKQIEEVSVKLYQSHDDDGHEANQTVVYLDLCHFSEIIGSLEIRQRMGPRATQVVQEQVEELIRGGLTQTDLAWDKCFVKSTGDGAILCFPSVISADQFAEAVLRGADELYNQQAAHDLEYRCFRLGVYTGNLIRRSGDVYGAAVSFAARLESVAIPGEIVMDARSWAALSTEVQAKYGAEEEVRGKQHDRPFLVRRRRVGLPSPWDRAKAAEKSDDFSGSESNSLDSLLEALTRLHRSSGVAEPPGDLGQALREGKEQLDQLLKQLAGESLDGLTLGHLEAVTSEAIRHGAGIYNHSPRGRVGCGEFYFLAASGLLKLGVHTATEKESIPTGASLALSWLRSIVESVGQVTNQNGDDVAWELRYCFDSIQIIDRCDQATMTLHDIARRGDVSLIARIIRQIVEKSSGLRSQLSAYELRHTVRALLWLCNQKSLKDREFCRAAGGLRRLQQSSSRIDMRNSEPLQHELTNGLIKFCQDIEASEGNAGWLSGWWKR